MTDAANTIKRLQAILDDFNQNDTLGILDYEAWKIKFKKLDFREPVDDVKQELFEVEASLRLYPELSKFPLYMQGPTAKYAGQTFWTKSSPILEWNEVKPFLNKLLAREDVMLYDFITFIAFAKHDTFDYIGRKYKVRFALMSDEPFEE